MAESSIPRPAPLRAAVYDRVVERLSTGRLRPGEPITEAGLGQSLGVSRSPVREALLRLEAEGVLESFPARGFLVRPLDAVEAAELYPIIAELEGLAVRTSPAERSDVDVLRELDDRLLRATDPVEKWRLDTEFHERIVEHCPNATLRAMLASIRIRLSRYEITFMREGDRSVRSAGQHREILDALADGDRERAGAVIARNWDSALGMVLGWLSAERP
ncbi:GntR family transcriptional regulator [Amycolatopsis nigrescens]|uniref:GntR family transcriptional regulator n=1 Tax=Amycolatopsis nigrescens TaxID=381445 RepID=UPI00037621BC|nr:GntR family transcriptional regulator [Amycolatopsis nigrescens]